MRGANDKRTGRARALRRDETEVERKLWRRRSNRQLADWKFVRQESIGPYFADFACRKARLVVEVDGSQHAESQRDQVRDALLAARGYRVLRFWNPDAAKIVSRTLFKFCRTLGGEYPSPRLRGEVESARSAEPGEGLSTTALDRAAAPHPLGSRQVGLSPRAGRGGGGG